MSTFAPSTPASNMVRTQSSHNPPESPDISAAPNEGGVWNEAETEFMVNFLVENQGKAGEGFTSTTFNQLAQALVPSRGDGKVKKAKHCKLKWNRLKDQWKAVTYIKSSSGKQSKATGFHNKGFPYYDRISSLHLTHVTGKNTFCPSNQMFGLKALPDASQGVSQDPQQVAEGFQENSQQGMEPSGVTWQGDEMMDCEAFSELTAMDFSALMGSLGAAGAGGATQAGSPGLLSPSDRSLPYSSSASASVMTPPSTSQVIPRSSGSAKGKEKRSLPEKSAGGAAYVCSDGVSKRRCRAGSVLMDRAHEDVDALTKAVQEGNALQMALLTEHQAEATSEHPGCPKKMRVSKGEHKALASRAVKQEMYLGEEQTLGVIDYFAENDEEAWMYLSIDRAALRRLWLKKRVENLGLGTIPLAGRETTIS
ncbi:hypothetical protein K439DRAFT_1619394 [Ramaria rubella]|nr:hypothetical protein K439DRAFT_1619394 [Ramaria rubella]